MRCPVLRARTHLSSATRDPFIHQEMVEIFYHTLWETVHVFFEHRELGQDVGQSEFLYPFLGHKKQETTDIVEEVAASIQMKVHDDTLLRTRLAEEQSEQIANAARAIHQRLSQGGKADYLREWRVGHRRQRLGARLRAASGWIPPDSGDLALDGAGQYHRTRQ